MADPLRSGHVLETVVFGVAEGQTILNIFHHRLAVQPTGNPDVTIEEIAAAVRGAWRTGVVPNLSVSYQAIQYQVTAYDAIEGGQGQPPAPFKVTLGQRSVVPGGAAGDTGARADDYAPTFVAAGLIKRTKQAGREGRGAIRLGPLAELDTSGNLIDPGRTAALKAALVTLFVNPIAIGTSATTTIRGVVYNRTKNLLPANVTFKPDGFVQDITAIQERPFASSQTSRKRVAILGA
jgi:hypothetical protein